MARVPGQRALVAGSGAFLVGLPGGAGYQPGGTAITGRDRAPVGSARSDDRHAGRGAGNLRRSSQF